MIFGKYQLLELLGRGGMAEVFKAKSYGVEGFEKLLVIKRILPALTDNPTFVDMFIDEAKIAVSLNHANIVQVFDLGKVGNSYYIAMEFVQGFDMSTIIKRVADTGKAIPADLAAYMTSEIAKGLDYAHRRRDQNLDPLNIIHRDISPHNILISFEGEVKITDFGIAKAKTTIRQETPGSVKGKYAYMAPEQALAKPHDKRVDIFSTGIVLYEAITGINPFKGLKSDEVIHKVKTKSYPLINSTQHGADAPQEICNIVYKALEPNPNDRFADASELYEALISFLYSVGARCGAHAVSDFLKAVKHTNEIDFNLKATGKAKHLVATIDDETSAPSTQTSPTSCSISAARINMSSKYNSLSDVTSVQIPTQTSMEEETSTTSTVTRSLTAELRDVTFVAAEVIGQPPPIETINKLGNIFIQDGGMLVEKQNDLLVGVFGINAADGRDTQEAISASLKLQRALMMNDNENAKFKIGVGVHPDNIIITAKGKPREDDHYFKAVQSARDIAKRGIGCVCTSAAGRELASDYYRFEEITSTSVAGVNQLLCKVIGHRPIAETYGKLIGRKVELRKIGELLAIVSRNAGKILALTGCAGTGKTRILHEVNNRLIEGGHALGWHEATCVPWRNATPYSAIATMFRSILAVAEIEPEDALKEKLYRLRELGLIPEEIDAISVLMGISAEQESNPEERGRQLRSALIRAASSLASDQITVLFWDDLDYIDSKSLEIIRHLARSITNLPILLALGLRSPELLDNWKIDPPFIELELRPLSEIESKRLAKSRLSSKEAPDALLMDIALKSDGNPLYIEEYIKALIANDIVSTKNNNIVYNTDNTLVDLPKNLRGLVGARINRLQVTQKSLLQQSSVMGQRFNIDLLSRVTGIAINEIKPVLLDLKDVGLLNRISSQEFTFASDLVRDVVYQGIVLHDRREIHSSIALAIEEMFEDRIEEFVERLAVHYSEGGDRARAIKYLIRAGNKVSADYSHKAAIDYYIHALELLNNVSEPDDTKILSLYRQVGELAVKTNMITFGLEKMYLAEELAEKLDDKETLIHILKTTAELQTRANKHIESQQYFQHAITLADKLDDEILKCEVRATAGECHIIVGDMKKALPYYQEAIELFPENGSKNLLIICYAQLAKSQASSGFQKEAEETIKKAAPLFSESVSPITRCIFDRSHAQVLYMLREIERSTALSIKALEIAKEYNLKEQIVANAHNIGDAYVALGDYRKAFSYLRMSQEVAIEINFEIVINLNKIFLAFIDALKFGSNEGLTQLKDALQTSQEHNTVWEQTQVHYFLGRIYFERKKLELAKSHLEQSIEIGLAANNKLYEAQSFDLIEQIDELST